MTTRMKIAEVRTAMAESTLVAVGKYGAKPAYVLETNQRRKVYSGERWDFAGHWAQDGIKVRFEDGTEKVVGPTEILSTWEAHQERTARNRSAEEERQANLAAQKDACEAAVAALGTGTVAMKYTSYGINRISKHIGWEVKLTAEQATALAERIQD